MENKQHKTCRPESPCNPQVKNPDVVWIHPLAEYVAQAQCWHCPQCGLDFGLGKPIGAKHEV